MTITKHDIKALRNADSLVFFHNVEYTGERGAWLKATRDARNSSTGYDESHWVRLTGPHTGPGLLGSRITNYEGGMGERVDDYPNKGLDSDQLVGSVVLLNVSVRFEVKTWLKVLREGDTLTVEFIAGNGSETLRKAGLTMDEAWVWIYRTDRTGRNVAVGKYHLDETITGVWSTARMVRPAQRSEVRV